MASLAERRPEATPPPSFQKPPEFPNLKNLEREQDETQLLRLAQQKLWAKKGFRKATRGQGFMRKEFKVKFIDETQATLNINYKRNKTEERLEVTWNAVSPSKKDYLFEQKAFIAVSPDPNLSAISYISSFYRVKNGTKTPERGTPFDLSKAENIGQIRAFFSFYL